jgi:hypothetical protein
MAEFLAPFKNDARRLEAWETQRENRMAWLRHSRLQKILMGLADNIYYLFIITIIY